MRKRRCNPPWDDMNKSAYHPVLLIRDWTGPPSLIRSPNTEPHVSESIRAESRRGRSFTEGEDCEDHRYSVLNATNALDVGPETRLPGRALSIAAPSCQQQPNGLSIWDL
ncbi:hypothetical protein EYF80_000511 [Liparis tanakae]|uniref:Uncharacterized protein n=1 Tax=Liparis tanakae TaxID=230148 RepID=A0A4Z2JHE0_9TELE|nr:hypothetical protein EYF80_000511 [Liparis tanakae]